MRTYQYAVVTPSGATRIEITKEDYYTTARDLNRRIVDAKYDWYMIASHFSVTPLEYLTMSLFVDKQGNLRPHGEEPELCGVILVPHYKGLAINPKQDLMKAIAFELGLKEVNT